MFEYKLLPVPAPSKKSKGCKTMSERFSRALEDLLNELSKDNWEFNGQETFPLDEKPGFMGKEKHIECRYLVFRRETRLEAMPLDQKLEKLRERKSETVVKAAPPPPLPATPFPEPMPSPQAYIEPEIEEGEEPTRIFSPFSEALSDSTAPALGPAEKSN